jgi:uncharacterized phage-associated protein
LLLNNFSLERETAMEQVIANRAAASTVASVANEFLSLGRCEPEFPKIDQMKLQKLLFYAHAWHLAVFNQQPLFEDDFEAWPWGPVVRDVYLQTRDYGRTPVQNPLTELALINGEFQFHTPQGVEGELKSFIKSVWDVHKSYTGIQLSNSTHAPGEPWTIMKDRYISLDSKPKIPNELIADVFLKKLSHAANTAA